MKLREMSGGLTVLRAESWSEGVDVPERGGVGFPGELSRDRQVRGAPEEVLGEVHGPVGQLGQRGGRVQRESRHAEHLPRALAVRGGDQRRLEQQ